MKKVLSLLSTLFLASIIYCQNLDTILIRPGLTMQAQDWAWLIGGYGDIYPDSSIAAEARRIRLEIKTLNPPAWTTSVTVDSIKGTFAMKFYQMVKSANGGEIAARYTAITSAIESVSVLSTFISIYNDALLADFTRKRNRGKTIIMDN